MDRRSGPTTRPALAKATQVINIFYLGMERQLHTYLSQHRVCTRLINAFDINN